MGDVMHLEGLGLDREIGLGLCCNWNTVTMVTSGCVKFSGQLSSATEASQGWGGRGMQKDVFTYDLANCISGWICSATVYKR